MKTNTRENSIPTNVLSEFEGLTDINSRGDALNAIARNYLRFNRTVKPASVADDIVYRLKRESDSRYGDAFNRLVCTNLDAELLSGSNSRSDQSVQKTEERLREELTRNGQNPNLLKWSERVVRERIQQNLGAEDLRWYRNKQRGVAYRNMVNEARTFTERFRGNIDEPNTYDELRSTFETLWALTVIGQPYPLEDRYAKSSIKQQLASSTFEDRDLTLASLVCMSYVHQPDSKPGTVRVTPGPIEKRTGRDNDDVDALEKLRDTKSIYELLLGENRVRTYAILSDIDFVDVFRVTETEALAEAREYADRYRELSDGMGLIPLSFMNLIENDSEARCLYEAAKDDIAQNIQQATRSAWRSDPAFYYNDAYIDALSTSIFEYYNSLPGITMSREIASQNTVDKLRVYGSQPEVLRRLFSQGFLFVSSETPVRDAMYMPRDKALKKERIPILYPLTFERQEE